VRSLYALILVFGCSGATASSGFSSLRPACPDGQRFDGTGCKPFGSGASMIDSAEALLTDGEPAQAVAVIARAVAQGPHRHRTHVQMYEQLGRAYAFQDKEPEAVDAYVKLLALSPGHLLSYHLSAKATFKFEKARLKLEGTPDTSISVGWPDELDTKRPMPIDVEVVADPQRLLSRAVLYVERNGERRAVDLELPAPGVRKRVMLPALGTASAETLKVHLVGLDQGGNEVALWAAGKPRSIFVDYTPPTPWYRNLKIMIPAGAVVVAAVGLGVYLIVRPEPDPGGVGQF